MHAHGMIISPWSHADYSFPHRLEIREGASHGRIYGGNTNLSWYARTIPGFWEPVHGRLDSVNSRIVSVEHRLTEHLYSDHWERLTQDLAPSPRHPYQRRVATHRRLGGQPRRQSTLQRHSLCCADSCIVRRHRYWTPARAR